MLFKDRTRGSQLPEVNLVPMMDVLMTVLTFFIIISMTLTGQQIMGVNLPQTEGEGASEKANSAATLVVGLNPQGQILVDNQPLNVNQLAERIQAFLAANPEGMVLLKADRELTYNEVAQLLKTMRRIGGSRVSLAIDRAN